jgi:hypothetical protein
MPQHRHLLLLLKHFLRLALFGHVQVRLRRRRVELEVVPVRVELDPETFAKLCKQNKLTN